MALRAQGKSKRKIAAELGIHRNTVSRVLDTFHADAIGSTETVRKKLVPAALARVEQVLPNDTDTARWVLDNTLFRRDESVPVVHGDATFNTAIGLLPGAAFSTSSPPSTDTSSTNSPGTAEHTVSTGTEAAAKAPSSDIGLSSHTNFSQFSLAELEAEVARRKAAQPGVLDAEVVG